MKNKWKNAKEFQKETLGKKYDIDKIAGVQCVDYFKEFTKEQCGTYFATGNGKATGYWKKTKKKVVALGFEAIFKKTDLKAGDWLITKETAAQPDGHIGSIVSVVSKGKKVKLQGQNQGGKGGAVNVIEYPLTNFLGAYRYEKWPKEVSASKFKVGDKVKPVGDKDYTGQKVAAYNPYYIIAELEGDRAVLRTAKNVIWAAYNIKNLKKA